MALVALLIFAKLFFVQILHHSEYVMEATNQYVAQGDGLFDRGTIYFTQKDGTLVPAATLITTYKLAVSPQDIKAGDRDAVYQALNAITPIDQTVYDQKIVKPNDQYEVLADHLTEDVANQIKALGDKGVILEQEKQRFYPGGTMASQTLGFVGYQGNTLVGQAGLEREYNDVLSRSESDLYVNFFAELFTNLHKTFFSDPHAQGDVITSIEPQVQHTLETTLQAVSTTWHTDSAGGIIIDPQTGNILAMAGFPDFDPNNFSKVTDPSVFQNPNIERVYELGSVIKSLTMSSGLDSGAITTATTYNDPGCMNLNKEHICNFDKMPRGTTTMQTIFDQSLNMGATFIQEKMGQVAFRNYFYKFGVNQKTGVDMPDEVSNIITNLTSNLDVDYATASYGQGIALTPVSAVEAFSAVANNGMRVSPRVAIAIQYPDGYTRTLPRPAPVQVVAPEVAQTVAKMLTKTVDTALLGGELKLTHYTVAAKTGTAQVANPNGGGYYANVYLHSMFGFYPASNPRFLTLLYIVNPKNVNYASQTLAKPFMDLAQFLLTYYDVAPDR